MALSKKTNSSLPKDVKKRLYKSRKQRPCDNCRKRKSCCIIEDGIPCKLCKTFNKPCTFDKGPVYTTSKFPSKKLVKQQATLIHEAQAGLLNASSIENSIQPIISQCNLPNEERSCSTSTEISTISYHNGQTFPTIDSIEMYLNNLDTLELQQSNELELEQYQQKGNQNIHEQHTFNTQEIEELWCMPLDLDMNLDFSNFQSGLLDLNIDFEQFIK